MPLSWDTKRVKLRDQVKKADGERIVVWANAVGRYTLTVPEQRLILWLVGQIEREDAALKERTVSILEMEEITGGNNGRIYQQFEAVCDRLLTRMLELLPSQGRAGHFERPFRHTRRNVEITGALDGALNSTL